MRTLLRVALLAASFAAGTIGLGWWAIPLLALAAALLLRSVPRQALLIGAAAGLAWAGLLASIAVGVAFWPFASIAASGMGLSGATLLLGTILFPALLAWGLAQVIGWFARAKADATDGGLLEHPKAP